MKPSKITFLLFCVSLFSLPSCDRVVTYFSKDRILKKENSTQLTTLKFQDYPGIGNLLMRVAIKKNFCNESGIACELQSLPSAPLGAQAMLAGSLDSFSGPLDVLLSAQKNKTAMKMVASTAASNVLALIAGNHLQAQNLQKGWPHFMNDLVGKKIGVTARGAATELYIKWMFKKANLAPDSATFIAVGAPLTGYSSLLTKQVDFLMTFEPAVAICSVTKTCQVVWRAAFDRMPEEIYATNGASTSFIFQDKFINEHPEAITSLLKALTRAEQFVNDPKNFEELYSIVESYFKLDLPNSEEITKTALRNFIESNTFRIKIDRKALKANFDLLKELQEVSGPFNENDFVYERAP